MKTKSISLSILLALFAGPILALCTSSCVGPVRRAEIRQETRIENRVEHRQARRRGW